MHGRQRANFARSILVDEQSLPETPPHIAGAALIDIALQSANETGDVRAFAS
jgi:hypothetical protein